MNCREKGKSKNQLLLTGLLLPNARTRIARKGKDSISARLDLDNMLWNPSQILHERDRFRATCLLFFVFHFLELGVDNLAFHRLLAAPRAA